MNKLLLASVNKQKNPTYNIPETEELVVSLTGEFSDTTVYELNSFKSLEYYPIINSVLVVEGISSDIKSIQVNIDGQILDDQSELVLSLKGTFDRNVNEYTSPRGLLETVNTLSNVSSIQVNIED